MIHRLIPSLSPMGMLIVGGVMMTAPGCTPKSGADLTSSGPTVREAGSTGKTATSAATTGNTPDNAAPDSGLDALVAETVNGLEEYIATESAPEGANTQAGAARPGERVVDGKSRRSRATNVEGQSTPNGQAGAASLTEIQWATDLERERRESTPSAGLEDVLDAGAAHAEPDEPAVEPEVDNAPALASRLADALRDEAGRSEHPLREYVASASLKVLSHATAFDPERVNDVTESERRILKAYDSHFRALGKVLAGTVSEQDLISAADSLRRDLAPPDALRIPTFRLCTSVKSFGNYAEFSSAIFPAGRTVDVLAYAELDNLRSVQNRDGMQETRLTQQFDLMTSADGAVVYSVPPRQLTDSCRSVRRDFFIVEHLRLPASLGTGRYILRIRVTDQATGLSAESTTTLELAAIGAR